MMMMIPYYTRQCTGKKTGFDDNGIRVILNNLGNIAIENPLIFAQNNMIGMDRAITQITNEL